MGIASNIVKLGVGAITTIAVGKLAKTYLVDRPKMTYSENEYKVAERKLAGIRKELRRTRITLAEMLKSNSNDDIYSVMKDQEAKLVEDESYYENIVAKYKQELGVLNDWKSEHAFF